MFGTKRKFCRVYFLAWVLLLGYSADSEAQSLHAIEDKLAIAEQLASYSYRWDAKDAEGFSDLFADDGVMERCRADELVKTSRVTGRQAIFDYAKRSYEGRLADRQSRHHFSALVFPRSLRYCAKPTFLLDPFGRSLILQIFYMEYHISLYLLV